MGYLYPFYRSPFIGPGYGGYPYGGYPYGGYPYGGYGGINAIGSAITNQNQNQIGTGNIGTQIATPTVIW